MSGKIKVIKILGNPKRKGKKKRTKKDRKIPRRKKATTARLPFIIEAHEVHVGPGRRGKVKFSYWTGRGLSTKSSAAKRYESVTKARNDIDNIFKSHPSLDAARVTMV